MSFQLMVGVLTCLLTLIWGGPFIDILRHYRLGKNIRSRGAGEVVERHLVKQGTPTFGGLLMIFPAIVITLLINAVNLVRGLPAGRSILVPLAALVFFGIIGAIDDWEGIMSVRRGAEGLPERVKFGFQVLAAGLIVAALYLVLEVDIVAIPAFPFSIRLGWIYIPIAMFLILATSNSANFADGLDGLAGNISLVAFGSYAVITWFQGQTWLSAFCFIMVGCLLGFLWFNANPARVFMGDTGSQALGATLAVVSLMSGQWLLLPIIGSMFLVETLSVIIQRIGFRYGLRRYGDRERGRIFRMAPIHHHFEHLGWNEAQIVYRFFFIAFLSGLLGIALALL
jgi:phospho-N-acetylmuramoyl-pentapeptide-transferase